MTDTNKVDSLFAFRLMNFFDFFQAPDMDLGIVTTPKKLLRFILLEAPDDRAFDIVLNISTWPLRTYPQRAMLALGLDQAEQDRRMDLLEKIVLLRIKQYGMLNDRFFDSTPASIWTEMGKRLDDMKRTCSDLPALPHTA